jgi:hypothetical protein
MDGRPNKRTMRCAIVGKVASLGNEQEDKATARQGRWGIGAQAAQMRRDSREETQRWGGLSGGVDLN